MSYISDDAQKLLAARIDDHLRQAERGELECGNFLTPAEAAEAKIILRERRAADRVFFFGGYKDAERRRMIFIPSYLADLDGDAEEKAGLYCADELALAVCSLMIKGSGFRNLSHRDYLGSLLALGIERREIGDIVVLDEHEAIVFCTDKIRDYLLTSLERIATDRVTVSKYSIPEDFAVEKKTVKITDTVASPRFDCVIGALLNLSREKAQNLINSGLCEVDHLPEIRVDRQIEAGAVISARGYGKFSVISFDGETRRGRIRMSAEKYV